MYIVALYKLSHIHLAGCRGLNTSKIHGDDVHLAGFYVRGSYSKVNYDDSFKVSHGKESSEFHTTVVLRLDSKMKAAWTMLDHVNRSLYSSTTQIILTNKPIFDEQKTILIKIDIAIQEIYSSGLTKSFKSIKNSKFFNIPILNDQTTFLEWNNIANDINLLIDELKYAIDKESTYETIGGNNTSVGENWLETHVRSHIAFACARGLRAEMRFVVRAHIASANS